MKRIGMRKIREVLRLKFEVLHSSATIARIVALGETTVETYLARARRAHISWPLPQEMDDAQLEEALYPTKDKTVKYLPLQFEKIHKEFKKTNVTLQLLWEEYMEEALRASLSAYCYSMFCDSYQKWRQADDTWMIQAHKAGEQTFVDYAGTTIPIFNREDGKKEFDAQIFVSALGASGYIFCHAAASQKVEDWIGSHQKMCEHYGGVTECWVPDNLKSAVTRADRYEPDINLTYGEMAAHYGSSVLPARVRRPQDKSKAESSVYLIETQILARLRDSKFYSLCELNKAILLLLDVVNRKPFQKMPGSSRHSLYLEVDKPSLRALPEVSYDLFLWKNFKVGKNYHVPIDQVLYSLPHTLTGQSVACRYNKRIVEFFLGGNSVAVHIRSLKTGDVVTQQSHLPPKHLYHALISPEFLKEEAAKIGEETGVWVDEVLKDPSFHIKQRIHTALGVVRLVKLYSAERLNAACQRGLFYKNFRIRGIKDILAKELDKVPLPSEPKIILPQNHTNIRGPNYYS